MTNFNSPLVTIVTPAFNAERLISRTIVSVLDQTFQNWEMLVVDDCSKDATREVVASFSSKDSRIRLISLEKNHGAPAAPRNIGVREARGSWIAFLDADDVWHPEKLASQLHVASSESRTFISSQMVDFIDDSLLNFKNPDRLSLQKITFNEQRIKGRIPTSSVLVTRDLMLDFPFNEDIRYKAVEDYHCWLRILASGVVNWKVQFPFLHYRRMLGQISGSKRYMLERMYMLHREFPETTGFQAGLFTISHALGGFYYRVLRRGL